VASEVCEERADNVSMIQDKMMLLAVMIKALVKYKNILNIATSLDRRTTARKTRSSATAEKQRVSCRHTGG